MKSVVPVTVLLLVIVAAGVRLLWFYGSRPEAGEPIPHFMPVACEACGQAYAATVGRQPAKCRYCAETAVWRAQKCFAEKCGVIFAVVRGQDQPLESELRRCPKCGSARVGEVPDDEVAEP